MAAMTINEILGVLSNANTYKIFQAIARRQENIINYDAISTKKYYTGLSKLKKSNLVIKQAESKQYVLSNLGKVVWNFLQHIDKSLQLQYVLKALDTIHSTDIEKDAKDEIVQLLIPDEQIRNIVAGVKMKQPTDKLSVYLEY
jgi:hypothetical protein